MKVSVFGSGNMGISISCYLSFFESISSIDLFYSKNHNVHEVESLLLKQNKYFSRKFAPRKESTNNKIKLTQDLSNLSNTNLVIESITENLEIKLAFFRKLTDCIGRDVIVGTNTSSLSISELSRNISNPDNFIGIHFFNPIDSMKLVEITTHANSSQKVLNEVKSLCEQIDKTAIITNDSPGFIVNRIIMPTINDAIKLLDEKAASREDIDKAMKLGLGHPMGPLSLADLIGLDVVLLILNNLYAKTQESRFLAHKRLVKMVAEGLLGRKVGVGFFEYKGILNER